MHLRDQRVQDAGCRTASLPSHWDYRRTPLHPAPKVERVNRKKGKKANGNLIWTWRGFTKKESFAPVLEEHPASKTRQGSGQKPELSPKGLLNPPVPDEGPGLCPKS